MSLLGRYFIYLNFKFYMKKQHLYEFLSFKQEYLNINKIQYKIKIKKNANKIFQKFMKDFLKKYKKLTQLIKKF